MVFFVASKNTNPMILLIFILSSLHGLASGPSELLEGAKLQTCPERPNCVSSQALNTSQAIKPMAFSKSLTEVSAIIAEELSKLERFTLIKKTESYLHFEVSSRFLGFIDDLELKIDSTTQAIHIRSASRTGYSDLGVNRKRVDKIQTLLKEKL